MTCLPHIDFETTAHGDLFSCAEESPAITPAFRSSLVTENVVIPAQLLQATGNTGSTRDTDVALVWQPHSQLTALDSRAWKRRSGGVLHIQGSQRLPKIKRSSTTPIEAGKRRVSSCSSRPEHSRSVSEVSEKPRKSKRFSLPASTAPISAASQRSWRLSYTPGPDSLSVARSSHNRISHSLAAGSPTNPFESLSNIASERSSLEPSTNPFLTEDSSTENTASGNHSRSSSTSEPVRVYAPKGHRPRRGTVETIVDAIIPDVLQQRMANTSYNGLARRSTLRDTYEKAKERGVQLQRNKYVQIFFEYGLYIFLLLFVYFVLIGIPLWNGAVWWLWWVVSNKFVFAGGFGITLGIALFYAFVPLLILFEKDPPVGETTTETKVQPNVRDTALLIPCYKSAGLIAATLEAALKIFPPSHVFVIANGNSPEPLDNTEEICRPYEVNHIWSPIGSKIVAQFVGCYAAKGFKNVLLIDDDCALPGNFPVVTDRLVGNVKCIGYTIKSVGPNGSKGNYCQQAQDLEYKLSGLQREFAGRIGSATFPHGAISLWDRQLLVQTFHEHPGFNVSEDWFFGHVARELGCRITMCSTVFVETETPTAVFWSSGGSRGGFGEMTIFQQRFKRWNFFFVNGMWYNMAYIFTSWRLGWWEIGAKLFVFQEVYETLLYLLTPFILPISFYVRPDFCGMLLGSTVVMYLINVIIFNEVHLRRKNERTGWAVLCVYYLPYKIVLTGINVASCYWSLWKYAHYFARRHPKVTEDEKAVEVVVRLEENAAAAEGGVGRRLTVRTVDSTLNKSDKTTTVIPELVLDGPAAYEPVYEPESAYSGMSTPTRLGEGIGAVDFTTARGHLIADEASSRHSQSMRGDDDSVYAAGRVSATAWV